MLFSLDPQDPRPIYAQIVAEIREQVRRGELSTGDELPSVRELAESLGVNLHTVHRAYRLLREQGIIHLRLGQRARIAPVKVQQPGNREAIERLIAQRLNELRTEAYHQGFSHDEFRAMVEAMLPVDEGETR